ncbi:hypothetical protein ACI2K4_06320 [Micromonospora sp. NPDC050397]|uniref:hypothetical protein n=1 Tax=Micromonospora sp. NPDC050397 TaxID=3364279 RepID=UPI00384BB0AA
MNNEVNRGGTMPPIWGHYSESEPDFATCLLYLDCGDEPSRSLALLEHWYDEACRLLLPFVQPPGAPEPWLSLSAFEQHPDGRARRRRPQRWVDGLTEGLYQLSAHWADVDPAAVASELELYVFRFAHQRHIKLQVSVGFEGRPGRLGQVLPALVELTRRVGDVANPSYGEIVINAGTVAPATVLDSVLARPVEDSAQASRGYLRGYEWVTLCPEELLARLGGAAALRDTGAFAEVIPLRYGGAMLRATQSPADYRGDRVRAVFRALAPVLPPGQPRDLPTDLPDQDLSRIVFTDAAYPYGPLDLGPSMPTKNGANPPVSPAQQPVQAMAPQGWGSYGQAGSPAPVRRDF